MPQVLLIDDEDLILGFLRNVLKRLGYEVKVAHDGKEGIEIFDSETELDFVITDICMPKLSGNAVARYIRKSNRPHIPIVAISGFSNEIKRELFNVSLMKPFTVRELFDVIEAIKRNREQKGSPYCMHKGAYGKTRNTEKTGKRSCSNG